MSDPSEREDGSGRRPRDQSRQGTRSRRPPTPGRRPKGASRPAGGAGGRGPIRIRQLGGDNFEFIQPQGVWDAELDYQEGIELWKAGDPESARNALRYALSAYHDNIWIHVALGQIALDEFHDAALREVTSATHSSSHIGPCHWDSRGTCRAIDPAIDLFMRPLTV